MKKLGVAPVSDTSPQYTLPGSVLLEPRPTYANLSLANPPVIADPSSDPNGKPTFVVDSFKIAIYLDEKYPSPKYPAIFPSGTLGVQSLLMEQYFPILASSIVPATTSNVLRILDSRSVEYLQRTRGDRVKPLSDEEIKRKWQEARVNFESLGRSLDYNDEAGPFILGKQVSFIDFAIGGVFHLLEKIYPAQLKEMLGWWGGKWGVYWRGIQDIESKASQVI